jgi:hypothetical protein
VVVLTEEEEGNLEILQKEAREVLKGENRMRVLEAEAEAMAAMAIIRLMLLVWCWLNNINL